MLKRTIAYIDYDNNPRKEDCYFNLTKAELIEMEMGTTGGMKQRLESIVNEQDAKCIMEIFKDIILRSYGRKSPDGRRFEKVVDGKRLSEDFVQTEAYSELFMELMTNETAAASFINGIIPSTLASEIAANPQLSVLNP